MKLFIFLALLVSLPLGGLAQTVTQPGGGGGGSANLPSVTNVIKGDGTGNGADTKVAITSPTTAATLIFGTDNASLTFPGTGTLALTSQLPTLPLSGANGGTGVANTGFTITLAGNLVTTGAFNTTFAQGATTTVTLPTTSSTMARTDAGQTFTGTQVFGALTATTLNGNTFTTGTGTLTIAAAKTLTANNSLTLAGTDSTTMTFPTTSATIARTDAGQTFTGTQVFGALTATSVTGLTAALTPNAAGGTTLGAAALPFSSVYIGGAATNNIQLTGTSAAARVVTIPDVAADRTVVLSATSTTTTQALFATATAGLGGYRAIAAGDLPTTLTSGTAITNAALTTPTLGTPASGTLTNATGLPLNGVIGTAAQATGTETAAGDNYTFAGAETAALTSYITVQDTNSTNSNTSVGLIANCAGTSIGCIGLIANSVSGTAAGGGDLARFYAGSTVTNGALSAGTLEAKITAAGEGQFGATAPNPTLGTGGGFACTEGTAPTAVAAQDQVYCDSTNHTLMASQNGSAGGTNDSGGATFFPIQVNFVSNYTAASQTAGVNDSIILCNRASAITITLPVSGIPTGKTYRVKEIGAGACTITPTSGNMDGATSLVLSTLYQSIDAVWDGTQYWIY